MAAPLVLSQMNRRQLKYNTYLLTAAIASVAFAPDAYIDSPLHASDSAGAARWEWIDHQNAMLISEATLVPIIHQ